MPQPFPLPAAFQSFGLKEDTLKALADLGFTVPSPIQEKVIPLILSGKDVVGQAQTGTGKTAAFGIPAVDRIKRKGVLSVLIMTPTRELASQVSDEIAKIGKYSGIRTCAVYGGQPIYRQIETLRRGVDVLVATPGRLLDLLSSRKIPNFAPDFIVLDEADEMLDMGFLEDIEQIFTYLPEQRQTLMFSATMAPAIQTLAKKLMRDSEFIKITKEEVTNKDIKQLYYIVAEHEKDIALVRLLEMQQAIKAVVFCATKKEVDRVSTLLMTKGLIAKGLHGDMEQPQREQVISHFRSGGIDVLVATDVAARGLNVLDISHVVNCSMPFDPESYVHRIGRTARAGRKGVAITLVTPREVYLIKRLSKVLGIQLQCEKVPTLQEVKRASLQRLVQEITNQEIHTGASQALDLLIGNDMDSSSAALKVLSLIMGKQRHEGPDQVGQAAPANDDNSRYPPRKKSNSSFKPRREFAGRGTPKKYNSKYT